MKLKKIIKFFNKLVFNVFLNPKSCGLTSCNSDRREKEIRSWIELYLFVPC